MLSFFGKRQLIRQLSLIGIIWLSFWLALHQIDDFSFWIDEALTPLRSGYSIPEILSNRITIQGEPTQDTHLPVYYLLIHFTRQIFGDSDFAFRFPSALFAVLSVPLMFQLGTRLTGRQTAGILAGLLAAINPLLLWYAQEARMYTLLNVEGLLLLLVVLLAVKQAEENASPAEIWRWFGIYLFLALIAIGTHIAAVFYIAGHGFIWGYLLWRHTRLGRWLVIGGVAGALAVIPLLPPP